MINKILSKIDRLVVNSTRSKPGYILFESDEHHVFDNSFYLFRYLLNYKKLNLFYIVYNKREFKEANNKGIRKRNILLIDERINIHRLKNAFYLLRTKRLLRKCSLCFISYRNFYKEFKIRFYSDQTMINLRHGEFPIKNVTNYYKGLLFDYDSNMYFRVGTTRSIEMLPKELKDLRCKWFASPMPRNDYLFEDKKQQFEHLIKNTNHNEETNYILCMTTFRKNADSSYFNTQFPLQISKEELFELNKFLMQNNLVFIIKIHHDNILTDEDSEKVKCSNIMLLSDDEFEKNNLFVNDILQYCAMLITDYSSVLFDFLYFDRPIGFITADIEKFQKERGLYNLNFLSIGNHINTLDDLKNIFSKLINCEDENKEERHQFHALYNKEDELSGCEKIVNLFIKR